ncbi:unnamed protein product [Staurois parvus]|uniref:Uncharacterized protein n=1 Tax=Staurois parvus TaxID=386267 RepID=A0ABN9C3K2_9NEOB|nr:unnamed protein product [Staurois parvus]
MSWYADALSVLFTGTSDSPDSWRLLHNVHFSTDPALSFYVAYHFVDELLLFPVASTLL